MSRKFLEARILFGGQDLNPPLASLLRVFSWTLFQPKFHWAITPPSRLVRRSWFFVGWKRHYFQWNTCPFQPIHPIFVSENVKEIFESHCRPLRKRLWWDPRSRNATHAPTQVIHFPEGVVGGEPVFIPKTGKVEEPKKTRNEKDVWWMYICIYPSHLIQ